ncbi:MAG: hypothetical protein JMDDDDMK_04091 [Acidobacteria bacterium]|nr:hypothetical protein [Acidobacteriota bacterium]
MAGDGLRRAFERQALDVFDFGEIRARVNAQQRARRTILLTTERRALRTLRVQRSSRAKIALHRQQIVGLFNRRWQRLRRKPQPSLPSFSLSPLLLVTLSRFARDHRNGVVRALRGAIGATDASLGINIHLAVGKTRDGSGRASGQTFRVFAMEADRRREQALIA